VRETRKIPWVGASLYFATVAVTISAHVLDPDGNVSGAPALVLTLPWSIVLSIQPFSFILSTLIILFGAVINAAALYWFIAAPVGQITWPIKIGTLTVVGSVVAALAWFLNTAEVDNLVRIARGTTAGGIYIATDENGLRALSKASEMESDIFKLQAGRGLVFIRKGTRGRYRGRRFLIKGDRLVEPYPANYYDMIRDGAIEVERIKIVEGPHKGLEGWAHPNDLQRLGGLYAM
jgi:hypothetical protein